MRLVPEWFFIVARVVRQRLGTAAWSLGSSLLFGLALAAGAVHASNDVPSIRLTDLPPQAQQTYQSVHTGGPFPYPKDGVVFGNRERQLPSQVRGYYREYTVTTPGSRDRGARRIVCGGRVPAAPQVCFYTQDHYASFRRISP
jgi:ribonuclease T1